MLAEITLQGGGAAKVALKSAKPPIFPCAQEVMNDILASGASGGGASAGQDLLANLFG